MFRFLNIVKISILKFPNLTESKSKLQELFGIIDVELTVDVTRFVKCLGPVNAESSSPHSLLIGLTKAQKKEEKTLWETDEISLKRKRKTGYRRSLEEEANRKW